MEPPAAEPAPAAPMGAHPDGPPAEARAPTLPTPQDRLRAAFSSDLPENVMSPPAASRDPYARTRVRVRPGSPR